MTEYMSGQIDLGALGVVKLIAFKNEKKSGNQPDWRLYVKFGDKNREVGALWINHSKKVEVEFQGQRNEVEVPKVPEEVVRG